MTNKEFIEKYGKLEFNNISNYICQELRVARLMNKIGNFKIYNSKRKVKFYRKDKTFQILDFATIYNIGCDNIREYINS